VTFACDLYIVQMHRLMCVCCCCEISYIYNAYCYEILKRVWHVEVLKMLFEAGIGISVSDWLRVGRSGVGTTVGESCFLLSISVRTGPGVHSASCTMAAALISGYKAAGATHSL